MGLLVEKQDWVSVCHIQFACWFLFFFAQALPPLLCGKCSCCILKCSYLLTCYKVWKNALFLSKKNVKKTFLCLFLMRKVNTVWISFSFCTFEPPLFYYWRLKTSISMNFFTKFSQLFRLNHFQFNFSCFFVRLLPKNFDIIVYLTSYKPVDSLFGHSGHVSRCWALVWNEHEAVTNQYRAKV